MSASRPTTPDMLRWAGLWLVIACALIRCLVALDPFPYWSLDPARATIPITGLTPAASMSVDALMLLGCGIVLLGEVLAASSILWLPLLLWALGAVGVAIHAFIIRAGSVDEARIGLTWIAAFAAGLTAAHACRDPRLRRITLAAAVGLIAMLAAKGAVQVFVEHAMTVERFRADREGFLASQGWTPGSASARNFERRLNQPEATGWFGLSNVYATFAAACTISLLGCTVLAWREARAKSTIADGWAGLITIGALAAAGALILAGSKGGFVATALGAAMLIAASQLHRLPGLSPRAAGLAAVAVVLAAIAVIIVRGLIGTRIGELSLLFRWFYIQGASRAFLESPLFGTGPDGFKDAYMRLKPALSPEEVSSPHSVFFDLIARLGVFGILWAGIWLRWIHGLGAAIAHRPAPVSSPPTSARAEGWMIVACAVAPVLVSTWMERSMASPEQAAARLAGLAAWIGISIAFVLLARATTAALITVAIGALAAAAHAQIEVTALWDSSAAWMCLILGAASASAPAPARKLLAGLFAPAIMLLSAAAAAWFGVAPTSKWELALRDAAAQMQPMADFRARFEAIASGRQPDSMPDLLRDIAAATDSPVPASPTELDRAMAKLSFRCASAALPHLERASTAMPWHFASRETWVRVIMDAALAADLDGQADETRRLANRGLVQARDFVRRRPTAASYGLLGNVESAHFSFTKDPIHLDEALLAWEAGARLDPHGLSLPLQMFKALSAAGRTSQAKVIARRLLDLDALQKLDELKRLSDPDRAEVDRILRSP